MATATKHTAIKDPSNNAVRVEIFDQPYNLRGSDAEYILKLAEYVDGKMRAVSEQTHTVDTARLAVLAALNIADEYHLVKRNQDVGSSDYLRRAQHLSSALDEVLEDQGVKIFIEPKAILFLIGTEMDFETTKLGSRFTFRNPNETASCGCGESVSITPVKAD